MFELLVENNGKLQMPLVLDGVSWVTERRGTPGKLSFTIVKDELASFAEGAAVRLSVDGAPVFFGYVFGKKRDRQQHVSVTAYDQLRYLKNKDTYVYTNKTASDVVTMLAGDFDLSVGVIEPTAFVIASRVEDNATLLDMIGSALDLELTNKKNMFVLYDDFGKLTLKNIANMKLDLIIDAETGENFDYSSSIDDNTFNKVKLSYENKDAGKRDIYVVQDGGHINDWGVLQYFDTLKEGENGEAKAAALLELYNAKTRKLKITKAFGDIRVRAGCLVIVKLELGDVDVRNYMLVEKCTHTFNNGEHWMDLTLRGAATDNR
jgi:hypothetical protein